MMLGDYRSLTLNVVNRLTSVTRLFPNSFNDKFCDQMMVSFGFSVKKKTLLAVTQFLLTLCHRNFNLFAFIFLSATPEEVDGGRGYNAQRGAAQWWKCKYPEIRWFMIITPRSPCNMKSLSITITRNSFFVVKEIKTNTHIESLLNATAHWCSHSAQLSFSAKRERHPLEGA